MKLKPNVNPIVVEQTYHATIKSVWKAITVSQQMNQWFFENIPSFNPKVGFETQFKVSSNHKVYVHLWKVTEVIPERKISYSWKYDGYLGDSLVTWELKPEYNKTKLILSHKGIESFPQDNPDFSRVSCTKGWQYFICERLKQYLTIHSMA